MTRLFLALLLVVLAGCSGQAVTGSDARAADPVVAKPQRIVSLSLGTDEILCSLVDPRRIVGLSGLAANEDISHVAEIAKQIGVAVGREPEQIVGLRPDLLLAARYTRLELTNIVARAGADIVITTGFSSFDDIRENITRIGHAVGEPERARTLIAEMDRQLNEKLVVPIASRSGWRLLYYTPDGWTAGSATTIDDVFRRAGFDNAAADAGIQGHQRISPETLLQVDPDVIVIERGYARDEGFKERLLADPQLAPLSAIRNSRIAELPPKLVVAVSHYLAGAVPALISSVNALP